MYSLFTALAAAFGSFTQRVTGFGFGILVMIFFPYFTATYGEATALSSVINVCLAVTIALIHIKDVKWRVIIFPILTSVPARIICINIVAGLNTDYTSVLKRVLGGFLILLSIYFFTFSKKIKFKPSPVAGLICGLISGVTDGFFAMGGPPMVAYLVSSFPDDKDSYIASSQAFSAAAGIVGLTVRISRGLVTAEVLKLSAFGVVGMALGIFIGSKVSKKMNADTFRKVVYSVLAVSGVVAIIKG